MAKETMNVAVANSKGNRISKWDNSLSVSTILKIILV